MNKENLYVLLIVIANMFTSCSNDNASNNDEYLRIPDSHFEAMLIDLGIDSDGTVNQQMLLSDAKKATSLDLTFSATYGNITDATGIEGFTNINFLSFAKQNISEIDLSKNTKLETVYLYANQLTNIDLSHNTNLIKIDLQGNLLTSITGLDNAPNLIDLDLSFNYFETLTITNTLLEVFHMSHNDLTSLDITKAIGIKNILLTTNKLTSLDLSKNTLLETLLISDNKLQNIDIGHNTNLTHFYISSNSLTNLDVGNNQKLVELKVDRNPDLTCIKIQNAQSIPAVSMSEYQELNNLCN